MTTTETVTVDATEIKPLVLDEYPVNYDSGSINLYLYLGDDTANLNVTDHASNYDPDEVGTDEEPAEPVVGIDMDLDANDLFHLAMASGQALARMGDRANLAELIKGLVDELSEMR